MRILITMLVALSLSGCATSFSSLDDPQNSGQSNLIVGNAEAVKASIREAIGRQYPDEDVTESSDGVFKWSHRPFLDKTSFRLEIFGGTGLNSSHKEIHGFFYTVNTSGSQAGVNARYVEPLQQAINRALELNGLKIEHVSLLSKSTMRQDAQTSANTMEECISHVASDPDLTILKPKISLGDSSDQSFTIMTDSSKPTAAEKKAILRWGQLREKCVTLGRAADQATGSQPRFNGTVNSLIASEQMLIAELYRGNLTYGEFATRRQALANKFKDHADTARSRRDKDN